MMNHLKISPLLSLLTVILILMGSSVGENAGMIFAFFMATAMNFFFFRFSEKSVLKMCGAREISRNGRTGSLSRFKFRYCLSLPV